MLVLAACDYGPHIPKPDSERGVTLGFGSSVRSGEVIIEVIANGRRLTTAELGPLITTIAEAVFDHNRGQGNFRRRDGREVFQESVYLFGEISGLELPPASPVVIDIESAAAATHEMGLILEYLHWCPPRGYSISLISTPSPRIDEVYDCLIWDAETGFESATIQLNSERSALFVNLLFHFIISGMAILGVMAYFVPKLREVWPFFLVAWMVLLVARFYGIGPVPLTADILAVEPGNRYLDRVARDGQWAASFAGVLAALAIAGHFGFTKIRRASINRRDSAQQ